MKRSVTQQSHPKCGCPLPDISEYLRCKSEIDKYYWGKAKLWHDSKCIVSCGGAPLEKVKEYIQKQSGGRVKKKEVA